MEAMPTRSEIEIAAEAVHGSFAAGTLEECADWLDDLTARLTAAQALLRECKAALPEGHKLQPKITQLLQASDPRVVLIIPSRPYPIGVSVGEVVDAVQATGLGRLVGKHLLLENGVPSMELDEFLRSHQPNL